MVDREGGSGPGTDLDLDADAAAAVDAARDDAVEPRPRAVGSAPPVGFTAGEPREREQRETDLDLASAAAAAVAASDAPRRPAPVEGEHPTHVTPPGALGTPAPKAPRASANAFAPTAAVSELTSN